MLGLYAGGDEQVEPFPDGFEGDECAVEVFAGVGGHIAGAQKAEVGGDARGDDRIGIDTFFDEGAPCQNGAELVTDDDRDDGGVALADVVAEAAQVVAHIVGVFP